ncbi:MAG: SoxR reducing system RseC family protein [Gallionellaceae bacterium]|nr:SoxR reducing system RseC family protein [Gallionellaceae bacterium]
MIEARVRVVSTAAGMAWVSSSEQSGCNACQSQSSCGISGLGKYLSRHRAAMPLQQAGARMGDELLVCVDESELLRAGLFAYLLPALLAVVGAVLADVSGAGGAYADIAAALGAIAGFIAGLVAARFLAPTPHIHAHPLSAPHSPIDIRRTT